MKLIIINGAPGAGKSSVANIVHQSLPSLSFLLKFDAQRRFLKDRHENREEARTVTYEVCKAIIEGCFNQEKDVVFEGVLPDPSIFEDLEIITKKYNAQMYEFILSADKDTIIERNTDRPRPADALPDSKQVTTDTAEKFWNLIELLKNDRPAANMIDVKQNDLNQVSSIIIKSLSAD